MVIKEIDLNVSNDEIDLKLFMPNIIKGENVVMYFDRCINEVLKEAIIVMPYVTILSNLIIT